jgi:ferritin
VVGSPSSRFSGNREVFQSIATHEGLVAASLGDLHDQHIAVSRMESMECREKK